MLDLDERFKSYMRSTNTIDLHFLPTIDDDFSRKKLTKPTHLNLLDKLLKLFEVQWLQGIQ